MFCTIYHFIYVHLGLNRFLMPMAKIFCNINTAKIWGNRIFKIVHFHKGLANIHHAKVCKIYRDMYKSQTCYDWNICSVYCTILLVIYDAIWMNNKYQGSASECATFTWLCHPDPMHCIVWCLLVCLYDWTPTMKE